MKHRTLLFIILFAGVNINCLAQVRHLEENLLGKWIFTTTQTAAIQEYEIVLFGVGEFTYKENHMMEYNLDVESLLGVKGEDSLRMRCQMSCEGNPWQIKNGSVIVQKLNVGKFEVQLSHKDESRLVEGKKVTEMVSKVIKDYGEGRVLEMTPSKMKVQFADGTYYLQRVYSEASTNYKEANINSVVQNNLTMNPRGVYKLMDFVGRGGKTFGAIEDQYKICTDSMTLTLNVADDQFLFIFRDGDKVFDYTGEEPDTLDPHSSRIYDSNIQRFSMKWWSEGYRDRPLFPAGDWCIEHYEAGKFSKKGKEIVEAFMSPEFRDETNPLIGIWHPLGSVMNLQDTVAVSTILKRVGTETNAQYCILTPSMLLNSDGKKGYITPVKITNQESLQINDKLRKVTWLSPDMVAIALQTGYTIWGRATGGKSLIGNMPRPTNKNEQR